MNTNENRSFHLCSSLYQWHFIRGYSCNSWQKKIKEVATDALMATDEHRYFATNALMATDEHRYFATNDTNGHE